MQKFVCTEDVEMVVGCVVRLPRELQEVQHDEGRVARLHHWIERLCDPHSNLITELNKNVNVSYFLPSVSR